MQAGMVQHSSWTEHPGVHQTKRAWRLAGRLIYETGVEQHNNESYLTKIGIPGKAASKQSDWLLL